MKGNALPGKEVITFYAGLIFVNIKLANIHFLSPFRFALQNWGGTHFSKVPQFNYCIQNLLKKENKNICEPWGLVVTQVQGNQEDLLTPDGVDIFPWHLLLAKCFVKQTHDLKDFASVGSSKKKKKKKILHACKRKKKFLFLFKSHFLIPNHKLFLKTHTLLIFFSCHAHFSESTCVGTP